VGSIHDQLESTKVSISALSELGFTPAQRAKMGYAVVKTQNQLEEMQARARKEAGG
jgi:hypothetical protein